ncbi:uncharacterized protein LOC120780903 [Bactrocera tryoni]|uniref:uncharacterized protein LOC120780903 n=1 Tax=Bactrocera tryoni TaxID=59916 RepID=UPI001A95F91D|nr:uncharacterized protein LOC120780903 [Bactrocera tryoni]
MYSRDSVSKSQHTKQSQFEIMVEFMESHPNLAKGYVKCADTKQTSKHLWERLSENLNGDGPPIRDMLSWEKVWADYKTHIKAKAHKNKLHMSGTGGACKSSFLQFS